MENKIRELSNANKRKKLLKRVVALLSVIVLLFTVNSLKLTANTLSRVPTCGIKKHVHKAKCYDGDGNLVCGKVEHKHTDACYQVSPETPELEIEGDDAVVNDSSLEIPLDLSTTMDDSLLQLEDNQVESPVQNNSSVVKPTYELGEKAELSKIILQTGLGVNIDEIEEVGVVDYDGTQASMLSVEKTDGDYEIRAARDFDEVDLAILVSNGIHVVSLINGRGPAKVEEQAQPSVEQAQPTVEQSTVEQGQPAAEQSSVEQAQPAAEQSSVEQGQPAVEDGQIEIDGNTGIDDLPVLNGIPSTVNEELDIVSPVEAAEPADASDRSAVEDEKPTGTEQSDAPTVEDEKPGVSDTPAVADEKAADEQSDMPTVEDEKATGTEQSDVPAVADERPDAEQGDMPTVEDEKATGTEQSDAPAVTDEKPDAEQGDMPAVEDEKAAGTEQSDAPAVADEKADAEQGDMPTVADEKSAGTEQSDAPAVEDEKPDAEQGDMPAVADEKAADEQSDAPTVEDEKPDAEQGDMPTLEDEKSAGTEQSDVPTVADEKPDAEQGDMPAVADEKAADEQSDVPTVEDERPDAEQGDMPTVEDEKSAGTEQSDVPTVADEKPDAEQDDMPAVEDEKSVGTEQSDAPAVTDEKPDAEQGDMPTVADEKAADEQSTAEEGQGDEAMPDDEQDEISVSIQTEESSDGQTDVTVPQNDDLNDGPVDDIVSEGEQTQVAAEGQGESPSGGQEVAPAAEQGVDIVGGEGEAPAAEQGVDTVGGEGEVPAAEQSVDIVGGECEAPAAEQGVDIVGGEGEAPAAEQGEDTVGGEGEAPAAEKGEPSADEQETDPAAEQGETLSGEQEAVPADEQVEVTSDEQKAIPVDGQVEVSSDEQEAIPVDEQGEAQHDEQDEAPTDEQDAIPVDGQVEVSSDEQEAIPVNEQGEAQHDEQGEAPTDEQDEIPADEQDAATADEQVEAPSDEEGEAPSDEEGEAPSDEQVEAPSDEEGEAPSDEEGEAPSDEQGEALSDEQGELPSDEQGEAPSDEQGEAPSDEQGEAPSDEQGEALSDEQGELPSDEQEAAPADEEGEALSDEQDEVSQEEEQPGMDKLSDNVYSATIDLSEMETYPISLLDLMVRASQSALADEESARDDGETADFSVDYDASVLAVEESEGDYLVTPIQSFESTQVIVNNGCRYELTLVNCVLAENEAEEEETEEQVEEQAASLYAATFDLANVEAYPLSLNEMMTAARAEQPQPVEEEQQGEAEEQQDEVEEQTQDGQQAEQEPEERSALNIEYDGDLLSIVEAEGDYLITPIQSFESTQVIVNNGSRYELTLVNCVLAENEAGEEETEEQVEEQAASVYAATFDLADVEVYPLSLNEMMTAARAEQPQPVEEETQDEAEEQQDEVEEQTQDGQQAEQEPEEQPALNIEYDGDLLSIVEAEGDYLITPIQSFESTQVIVNNGSRYELTLVNCVLAEDEAEEEETEEQVEERAESVYAATIDLANVEAYPLSLNEMMTAARAEQPQPVEEETQDEAEEQQDEAEEQAQDGQQAEQEPEEQSALNIEYDGDLLSIVEAEGDYLITPIQSFESTQVIVNNGSRYELTLVNCVLAEDEAEEEETEEQVEERAESVYAATIDLANVEAYPLSLNEMMSAARAEQPQPVEEETQDEAEEQQDEAEEQQDEAEEQAQDGQQAEQEPEKQSALNIEYDGDLLSIVEAEGDYLITPIQSFESTQVIVTNGSRYELTLVNCVLAAEAEPEIAYPVAHFEQSTAFMKVVVDAPEGAFPDGTSMKVMDVEDEKTISDIEETVTEDFVEVRSVHAVDISFWYDDAEIEPSLPISVVMSLAESQQIQEAETVVVHVDDEGDTQVVESESAGEAVVSMEMSAGEQQSADNAADNSTGESEGEPEAESRAFEADSFSIYAMVQTEAIETRYIAADGTTWNISVGYGKEAEIPTGATLAVSEVMGKDAETYLNQTAEALYGQETITLARFFDITILNSEGQEVQPKAAVEVRATLADGTQDNVKAVHFAEEGPEIIEASQDDEAVVFEAEGFSVYGIVYTVDFHFGVDGETYEFTLPGGGAVGMRELAPALGLVADAEEDIDLFVENIENVAFSDESLVKVVPVEMNMTVGALKQKFELESEYSAELTEAQLAELNDKVLQAPDWALVSLKPFNTDEVLTITMKNGEVITVAVTDAQLQKSVISANGETYVITVTYEDDAEIPDDAELKVREILPGDKDYKDYLSRAIKALGGESAEIEGAEPSGDEPVEDDEAGEPAEAGEEGVEQTGADDAQTEYARFFDIQIWANEQEIEPKAAVSVRIELADAPEDRQDALAVVHFEADGPVVMDAEVVSAADIRFETESFSTYGVITTPSASQFTSSNVDDLIGKPFTLSRNGQYFKAEIDNNNNPTLVMKASSEADAGVWYIKHVDNRSEYILYTIDPSGKELQFHFEKYSDNGAHAKLSEGGGNWFNISKNGDNTYSFLGNTAYEGSFYLNYWEGSKGLAGYKNKDGTNHNDEFTVRTLPEPAQDNQNYFIILKQGDEYFAVLNDGRLEQVTVGSDGKFALYIEPMMWKYLKENNDHYLQHESYARTILTDRRAETWYYSYINPNAEGGFSDPWVCTPMHNDLIDDWREAYRAEHPGCSDSEVERYVTEKTNEYNATFADYDNRNATMKANSKIDLVNIGGKYYIKSATSNSFIGVEGGAMKGNVDSAQAAEVFFAETSNITTWIGYNEFQRMARHHVVEHIDIGVKGKAELHIPLPAGTYYDENGDEIEVPSHTVLRVKANVPIDSQDIKNAKLTAFQYGSNGEKIVVDDAYYITGYSGNAPTSISAAQVRYEGQFKVAWASTDPAHPNGGDKDNEIPNGIDPYEGNDEWRAWRLAHQVYYNVNLTKEVPFELEYNGKKLYNAAGKQMISKVPVELSGSFSYWDPNNECPAIHDDFNTENGYWHTGNYSNGSDQWYSLGWRDENDANKKINGIIPKAAWGNSGMDFILGGSKDQTAVVITKFIEDESGKVIRLQSETVSKVKVLQKDIDASNPQSETNKVKEQYTQRNTATNVPALSTIYDNSYRVYGASQRNIVVGKVGYGTIYDYDVRRGMVGVEEIRAQEGGFPEVVTDEDGKQWEYVHTYIRTDYVTRKNSDTLDKYHYTKNYTKSDTSYLSVPEVLGPYKRDEQYYNDELKTNTYDDNSDFLEFYIHNVYRPRKVQVEVEKEWKQGSKTIDPPSGATVSVPLKRYKLMPKEEFNQSTDKYLKAQVNVYRENYLPKRTLYRNVNDFHAGDTLTVTLEYAYNETSVRYNVNGQGYEDCHTFPDGPEPEQAVNNNHRLRYAFDVTVPEDGELTIDVDDNWTSVTVVGVTVKACNHGSGSQDGGSGSASESDNVDGVPVPPSPADKPDMVYTVDTDWEGETISLPGEAWNGSIWKGKSGLLDAYDENGNAYLYFIDEAGVTETNVPAGTLKFVGRASNGSYLTSTGFYYDPSTQQIVETEDNETLKVVNQVPATVTLLKKDAQSRESLVGARFVLYRYESSGWAMVQEIDMTSNPSATIPELYDGRYKLEEIVSPNAHKVLDNAMYFRVRNGEASLTNENGSAYTPSLDDNLIELNGSELTVKNTPVGKLEIVKAVTSASDATGQVFTFTVTLKNNDDSAYTGTATLTDKTHAAEHVTVANGALTVVITETGTATIDNLPVGTKFDVTEADVSGWGLVSTEWKHGGVIQEDTVPKVIAKGVTDTVTFTNAQLGSLKITKLVRLNGQQPSGDDIGIADGSYTFTVAGPNPSTAVLKYVQIKVQNGEAVSHRVADSLEELTNLNWTDGGTVLVENLVVGDYVITETDRGQLTLTDIAGGKLTQKEGQAPHNDADLTEGTVTVTVASGNIAQAAVTYTNSMYKTTINILKIDEATRGSAAPTKLGKAKFTLKKWNGTSTYEPVETQTTSEETAMLGTLSFTGLLDGEYKIEEDETPPGYVMVEDNDIYFSIVDGEVKRYNKGVDQTDRSEIPSRITHMDGESEGVTEDVVIARISYTMDFSTHSAQFTVGNTPGVALPSTGGPGTTMYYAAGAALLLLAVALLFRKKAKNE